MQLGFFTERNPAVHLLVNGEPVLAASAGGRASLSSKAASGGGVVRRGRHSAGNVTGWTVVDFLALPARAKVTVTYEGQADAQGFISLRKL